MSAPLRVVPYDPDWPAGFATEERRIAGALPEGLAVHHVGSTAVPGLDAKPILDMLGIAPVGARHPEETGALEGLGYEAMGAFGITGRRYYRKSHPDGVRSHHLHVFAEGSPHIVRHLAFRDFLRAHPDTARAYADLKRRLAAAPGATWESYGDGKDVFVKRIEAEALRWAGA